MRKLTQEDIFKLREAIPLMAPAQAQKTLTLLKQQENFLNQEVSQLSFLEFIKHVYPGYKVGPHHLKLIEIFEAIARGEKKRVIVNIAPRHGKSELISYLAPAWFLGKYPHKKVIMGSHTADLAVNFGRRVRNLVGSDTYKDIFPQIELQSDSKSASRWGTNFNGEYFAIGVGGALAGRGADLFIIDDPHSEQEAKQGRADVFLPAWEWFQSGPIQRLMPGGAIIVVMCMTGDTPVLMEDGTEKPLRDVRPGDTVATFDHGKLTTAKVLNHRSNGVDTIYQIQTLSGRILRANERHPFLVMNEGVLEWTRLKNLKLGDALVAMKDASDPHGQKQSPACVEHVCRVNHTTAKTPTPQDTLSGTTANGLDDIATLTDVAKPSKAKGCVRHTTTKNDGLTEQQDGRRNTTAQNELNIGTASLWKHTTQWLKHRVTNVMSAANNLLTATLECTGMVSSVSTITMTPEQLEDFCAMIATLQSGTAKHQKYLSELHRISDFTVDPIISITYAGEEEVFDVQIDRTENFIANGAVSHNTRWSKLDLTGQIVSQMERSDEVDPWEVVEFPAIKDDGKALWPEFWDVEELLAKKASLDIRYWNAQYMQKPTSEEGALIKREWWQIWDKERAPNCEFIIMSLDAAQETNNRADYNALTTWGVFFNEETNNYNIILLNAIKKRLEFPELKKLVLEEYKEWEPDAFMVEKKSNGAALYQELRRMGIPAGEFTPGKGQDKISRVNAISDLFASGIVWAPEHRWAKEVIEECNDFPSGTNDDLVDSTTLALLRFRQGGFIKLPSDEKDEDTFYKYSKKKAAYY